MESTAITSNEQQQQMSAAAVAAAGVNALQIDPQQFALYQQQQAQFMQQMVSNC